VTTKNVRSDDAEPEPTLALVDYPHLLEDFLDNIGVSFEAFREEMRGSWIFGYIAALRLAGVRSVMFSFSARVDAPERFTHKPTGATICLLPAPKIYRVTRRWLLNPYESSVEEAVGDFDIRGMRRAALVALRAVAPYLTTPLRKLAREIRREKCGTILCQEYEHPRFDACVLLGKLMRLPVFATFQGGNWQFSRLERPLRPLTVRACAGLIIAAQDEAERVRSRYRVPPSKVARIFNPIDLAKWSAVDRSQAREILGIATDAEVAIWHGRVEIRQKGLDVLLDAWEQVCRERERRNLLLLLVGSGADAKTLHRQIAARRSRSVRWVDEFVRDQDAIRRYLSAADLYVFPSRYEGFPVAPIEAMACGLPVAAANVHGIPDILEGGEAAGGLVVPQEDAVALASAIGRLLDDKALRQELGERARRRVESCFSLESIGKQLRAFIFGNGTANVART
jgi:glycosyltransferase involved in cell wall biosynthesis